MTIAAIVFSTCFREYTDTQFRDSRCFVLQLSLCAHICFSFMHYNQGQIFVNIAYESTENHAAGFLCLQIGLILVAIQNVMYITLTKQKYKIFCNFDLDAHHSTWLGRIYLIGNLIICIPKISATVYIVMHGVGPEFYLKPGYIRPVLGQDVDLIWMTFNAILPWVFAYFRMINEAPLVFDIHLPSVGNSSGEETAPLAPSSGEGYSTL